MKLTFLHVSIALLVTACGSRTDLAGELRGRTTPSGDGDVSGDGDGDGDIYGDGDGDGDIYGDGDGDGDIYGDGDTPTGVCGDGIIDPWEQCDDGGLARGDGCSSRCQWEFCGNGIVDAYEACDDGNFTNSDGCESDCTITRCGNGILDPGEACDDGNRVSGDGTCDATCTSNETCGNGIVDVLRGETCDDGNLVWGDGCQPTCRLARCGDGYRDPNEVCDDGNNTSGDGTCNGTCTSNESCGNGIIDALLGEECDDANQTSGDGCQPDCRVPRCGDGYWDPGEACDDGNNASGDGCRYDCASNEACGNGIVDVHVGEVCDDNNSESYDGCDATCRSDETCGNGKVDVHMGEDCDDGDIRAGGGCSSICSLELGTFDCAGEPSVCTGTFFDDFESYSNGTKIGAVSPSWRTWSSPHAPLEDSTVSSTNSSSGAQALCQSSMSAGPEDLVLPFGRVLNSGRLSFGFEMFIRAGYGGYFNVQGGEEPASTWAAEFDFFSGGSLRITRFGSTMFLGSYPVDRYFEIRVAIDFDADVWEVFIDGASQGTFYAANSAASYIDLYPVNRSASVGQSQQCFDDVTYTISP